MNKDNFIEILKSLSKEDIQHIIISKGKGPKLVRPIVYIEK